MICAHCKNNEGPVALSGMKRLSNDECVSYSLCKKCCDELRRLSAYSPADTKQRRDFWIKVQDQLESGEILSASTA